MANPDQTAGDTQPLRKPNIPKDATVLVVEDNVSNFVLIARMLGYLGIHCEWKTSGYEVVEYADTLPRLDLILMDIRLPYEDGYGALKDTRLRALKSSSDCRRHSGSQHGTNEKSTRIRLRWVFRQTSRPGSFPRSNPPHP